MNNTAYFLRAQLLYYILQRIQEGEGFPGISAIAFIFYEKGI